VGLWSMGLVCLKRGPGGVEIVPACGSLACMPEGHDPVEMCMPMDHLAGLRGTVLEEVVCGCVSLAWQALGTQSQRRSCVPVDHWLGRH
jgi:hypothetical protein